MARSQTDMQMVVGLGFLCLATLCFQALIQPTPATLASPDLLLADSLGASVPNAASLQAMQSIIAQLFSLASELNSTLSTLCPDCILVSGNQKPHIKPAVEEVDTFVLAFGGALVLLAWIAGLVIFLSSLADRSRGLMEKVVACGLLGANVSVACSIFWVGLMPWYNCVINALWLAYAAMVAGILFSKERDEEAPRRKITKN